MFAAFVVVGICAVQRRYGLAVPAPESTVLSFGGLLTGAARLTGMDHLSREGLTYVYMSTVLVMYATYGWALYLFRKNGPLPRSAFIIGAGLAFALLVLLVPPLLARDLFNYASYGRMIAVHGSNPYLTAPKAFPSEHVLAYISWRSTPSVYGPLFNYMAALIGLAAGSGAVGNVLGFKIAMLAFFAGSLLVVDRLARRIRPERADFILLAVAWNPLVLVHLVGGGHNDLMMVFFIVSAFLLYRKGYPALAVTSAVLACLVKSTAVLVLVPILVLLLRQNARWRLSTYVRSAAALVFIPLAFYLPQWPGIKGLKLALTVGSGYSAASVPRFFRGQVAAVLRALGLARHDLLAASAVRAFFLMLFLSLFVLFCYRVRDFRSLILYSGAILFAFTMTTGWLMPWYAGAVIMLVALSGSYRFTAAAAGMTLVLSLYGRGINHWTNSVFPLLLLAVAVSFLLLMALAGARASSSPQGVVKELAAQDQG